MFMLGLLGLIILHGKKLSDYVRENISVSVLLKENVSDEMVHSFRVRLEKSNYIKSSVFITRDQAAKELSSELGEDFVQFLGYNPLPASIDLQLKAGYANSDSIAHIEQLLLRNSIVKEVIYQKSLIDQVNSNIRKISIVILSFNLILLIISIILISNTIRLSIYARRFLIRSMQLVGATEAFIRMPFIKRGIVHGFIASILSIILLSVTLWVARVRMPELAVLQNFNEIGIFFVAIVIIGIILSALSTWFAVNKFLRMRVDQLYSN